MIEGEISEYLSGFLNFLRDVEAEYVRSIDGMNRQQAIETDCLHIREGCSVLPDGKKRKLTPKEKRRLDKIEEKCLVERRKNVDMIDKLNPIMKLLEEKETKEFIKKAKLALGDTRRIENNQRNRFYTPRVLSIDEIFDCEFES